MDDEGKFVAPDVMIACIVRSLPSPRLVPPLNLSRDYSELGQVTEMIESRTVLGNVALKASVERADLAGTGDGRYIFLEFLPTPDCFMMIGKAIELFGHNSLSRSRDGVPDPFGAVLYRGLECPWTEKGRVMRGLAEQFGGDPDLILTDGIKLNLEGGWVLMLPDPDSPRFHVYAEAHNTEKSRGIADDYSDTVENLINLINVID